MRDGWICLHRKIMDSGRVKPRKPYSDFAAWVDLLFEAAYEDHRIFIQGRMVDLKRGEVPHSLRTLAERWGWNLSAVKRFLDMLKTETQTKHRTEHGITLLVIANYDAYQSDASENETRKIEKPKHERNTNETNITRETRETRNNKETILFDSDFQPQTDSQPQQAEGMPEKTQAVAVAQREGIEVSGCSPKAKRDRPARNADVERIIDAYRAFKPADNSRTKARNNLPDIFLECPPDECLAAVERYGKTVANRDAVYIKGIGNFFTKANRVWEEYLTDDCLADVAPAQDHTSQLFGVEYVLDEEKQAAILAVMKQRGRNV